MSYEPAALSSALAAAVGDDHALVAELRHAFLDSAERHMDALRRSAADAEWREAALRLKGLAASFGAFTLIEQADRAAEGRCGDAQLLGDLEHGLAVLAVAA